MSDNRAGGSMVLNWRGPLLAAAIFAGVFAILLLMAHQNESNTSDEGSSFREDPYGTSLLFDSYERAGYQVERSQDEGSLADQNASRTTAFFIGGYPDDGWRMVSGKLQGEGKFSRRLEDFLARGGRVVLVQPAWAISSQTQGWWVENKWHQKPHKPRPAWAAPDHRAMPVGSEMMYLAADDPWLKTDAHWTSLYASPESTPAEAETKAPAGAVPPTHVYMAMRRVGRGELIAASQQSFLLNEAVKAHPNPVLLDFLVGGRPVIWLDETLHGLHQDEGVLWLVQRYRLQAALLLFWVTLLALLWSMSGDLVRRPARDWGADVVRHGEAAGVAGQRLLQRSIATEQIAAECWEQFRHRSPQDARAIATDPSWGPRLRAALSQQPLTAYNELTRLIAERRASAKGMAHGKREKSCGDLASPKKTSEEARTS